MKKTMHSIVNRSLSLTLGVLMSFSLAGCSGYRFMGAASEAQAVKDTTKYEEVKNILENEWYYGAGNPNLDSELTEKALEGMTSFENDPHTMYLPLDRSTDYSQQLAGNNVGLGVVCYQNAGQPMRLKSIFINSPADEAGLKAGDEILKIDDLDGTETPLDQIIEYIKGKPNTSVHLTVRRDGQTLEMDLTPAQYDSTVAFDVEDGYGLVNLSSFSQNSGKDAVEAFKRLEEAGTKNLILDLRGNTGGYLHAMQTIASAFLPADSVLFKEKLRDGTVREITVADDSYQANFDHVYILQNGLTASSSEVLIGALKDQIPDKVTTIGSKTYGKGTEQLNKVFDDGTTLKYTVAEWLTPNGTSVNMVGIEPDVPVEVEEYQSVGYRLMNEDEEPIRPDTVNDNAAALQIFLRELGYPAVRSDNYYSPESEAALRQFQSDNDLETTGEADAKTFALLVQKVSEKINTEGYDSDTVFQKALELMNS